jgi:hypothetical protein
MELATKLQIRRKRKAKRLTKKEPLFAFQTMQQDLPDYNYTQYEQDLKTRKKKKKKPSKSNKYYIKYGRYTPYCDAISNYYATRDVTFLIQAQALKSKISQPYTIYFKLGKACVKQTFPPEYPYKLIQELAAYKFDNWQQLDDFIKLKTKNY